MDEFVNDLLIEAKIILAKILALPFNQQLACGSLKQEQFDCYLIQDVWYLKQFSQVLQRLAEHEPNSAFAHLELAQYIRCAEQVTNEQLISPNSLFYSALKNKIDRTAIKDYVAHLNAASLLSFPEALAACIPCFWVYQQIGALLPVAADNHNKVYQEWLSTYVDQEFIAKTKGLIAILVGLESNYDQDAVRQSFMRSLQHEHDFFASITAAEPALNEASEQVSAVFEQ